MKGHLKHVAIGAAAVLAVLLIARVNPGAALRWAVLLACPLGMIGMVMMMNRHGSGQAGHGHEHGAQVGGVSTSPNDDRSSTSSQAASASRASSGGDRNAR